MSAVAPAPTLMVPPAAASTIRRHVVHLLYRFAAGGLENVVVQLINGLPRERFRHTIVALTQADPDFVARIEGRDVEVIQLRKSPGQPFRLYPEVYRLLRRLRPDVVHSCNLAALEFQAVAWAAGVPRRIHAEHGWDVADPDGRNRRYRLLRKIHQRFAHHLIAVSPQLRDYLDNAIGVPATRLHLIPNGVDTFRFRPGAEGDEPPQGFPFRRAEHWVIGTVGRLEPIKNHGLLADAFICLIRRGVPGADRLRLAIVGDGPLRAAVGEKLLAAGLADRAWLPGARSDIPDILRAMDCFVLPSLAEGTSCTLQEAMATALPIVVTDVGGNRDVLDGGRHGDLVPSGDTEELAAAIGRAYALGKAGGNLDARRAVEQRYGLDGVLRRYAALFAGD